MRVSKFHIDQFGILGGQSAEGLSPRLNIFLGHNEAGKSTLLHFFRAMFFNAKGKKVGAFDYGFAGKGCGGRLVLETGQGQSFTLARKFGQRSKMELHAADGSALAEDFFASLLSGYTASLYNQVFCFGLGELSDLAGMKARDVGGVLHAAAFGQGFKSPVTVLKALESAQEKLFAPRAQKASINQILARLGEVEAELQRVGSELELYNSLKLEGEALQAKLQELHDAARALHLERGRAQSLAGAHALWLRQCELEGTLAATPKPAGEFGPDSLGRLEAVTGGIELHASALSVKRSLREQTVAAIEAARSFMPLGAIWESCQTLQAQRSSIAACFDQLPGLRRQDEEAGRDLQEHLRSLGQDWTAEKALAFDDSLLVRQEISDWSQRLRDASAAQAQAGAEVRRLAAEALEAEEAWLALRRASDQPTPELSGLNGADELVTLYSPDMRAVLEQRGSQFARGGEALKEAVARQARLQEDANKAAAALAGRRQQVQELQAGLIPPDEQTRLQDGLSQFQILYAGVEQTRGELEAAQKQASSTRPPLLGPSTARKDTRRVPWLLLCLALMVLCWSGTYAFFTGPPLTPPPLDRFFSLAHWQEYLKTGWLNFALGLAFAWGALYWLSPRVATFNAWRFKPDALRWSVLRLQEEAAEKSARLEGLATELLALPALGLLMPEAPQAQPASAIVPGAAARLRALAPELEKALRAQEGLRGRVEALADNARLEEESMLRLTLDLKAAQEEAEEARVNQEQRLALWERALAPYALEAGCPPESALRIFDLGAAYANKGKKYLAAKEAALAEEEAAAKAASDWENWLGEHGFATGFDPGTVVGALEHIARVKEICRARAENAAESARLKGNIAAFAARVAELAAQAGQSLPLSVLDTFAFDAPGFGAGGAQELLGAFDALYGAASEADAEVTRLRERERDLERLEAEILEATAFLREQEKKLAALLEQGQCASSGEYALRFEQYTAYEARRQEKERGMALLAQAASAARPEGGRLWQDTAEFLAALRGSSAEVLQERDKALAAELEEALQTEKAGHTRLGEINQQLADLGSGQAYAALRAEASALQDKLEAQARVWSVQAMAAGFIKSARRSFEEERQDSVVRFASEFFAGMTGGEYRQIHFEIGDNEASALAVSASEERRDSATALSQGTREQLYLALRLAFIRQHNLTKESLPLIMDDILVNFDPGRAESTAKIFAQFCTENQGLFFTCHPHTADMLRRIVPDAVLYHMNKGRISRAD